MKELIKEMEAYAAQYDIPIMQKEGIEFFKKIIEENHVKTILELGTAIGYSAIQLASLSENIQITSVERNHERHVVAIDNVRRSGLSNQITLIEADALEVEIPGKYDCIFIDAAKAQYIKFFEKYKENLSDTGIIVSDNLDFHGYVNHPEKKMSRNLRQLVGKIARYINYLKDNQEYETIFYDFGDGIAVTRKNKYNYNDL